MTLFQKAVLIYAVGVVIAAAYTAYGLAKIRKSRDPEDIAVGSDVDGARDLMGLKDSGVAVFAGIIWPAMVASFIAAKVRRR